MLRSSGGVFFTHKFLCKQWLTDICKRVASLGLFGDKTPNHVLVNEYKPGEGILPHEDGPLYYPVVTNITLNSHAVIDFYRPRKKEEEGQNHSTKVCILSVHFNGAIKVAV